MDREIINYTQVQGITVINASLLEEFPSHWHNAAEFTVILKDNCRYKIGDKVYTADEGDILLVWPRELHELLHVPIEGSMFIQFSSSIIESHTDLAAASRFLTKCHLIKKNDNPELVSKLTKLFLQIKDIYNNKQHFVETRCKILIYDMLLLIGEYVFNEQREHIGLDNFSDRSWKYIKTALSFISEHSSEDITQLMVAEHVGLSPFYFSKLFNEYMGISFPDYLSGIRVQNAINLLLNDSLSITECAFMAGFQSTTRFNKLFREVTGTTPREYRKLHRVNT